VTNLDVPRKVETTPTGIQYGALPYRLTERGVEILLVTSRHTRRWIIPKGWPIEGCRPSDCAAREALEEAGVSGEIATKSIGRYHYLKQLKIGVGVPCKVDVFPLKVARERTAWAERAQRERRWCTVAEAAAAVEETELRSVILKFGKQMTPPRKL
jgi:8-oxo-dGTP pyrophosphatase MutT (NUDIX family)